MYNYFVFESRKTKERVIVKEIHNRMLKAFRMNNNVVVEGPIIDWRELNKMRRDENLRILARYISMSEVPAAVNFEVDNKGLKTTAVIIDEYWRKGNGNNLRKRYY